MSSKRLLILGYGYVGEFVANAAIGKGWEVWGVTRNAERIESLEKLGGRGLVGNTHEDSWHAFADTDFDYVLNCVSSAGNGLEGYRISYIEGNQSLNRWIAKRGFKGRAIFTSSVSVYPDAGGGWLDEGTSLTADTERGRLMREAEDVFLSGSSGSQKTVLRLGGIYGPGRQMLLDRLKEEPKVLAGSCGYYLNLIRVEDIVGSILGVFEKEAVEGVFTVVDDEPAMKAEIVEWVAMQLGSACPEFGGGAVAAGKSHRNLDGREPANRRLRNEKLKAAIGWEPLFPNFREGFGSLLRSGS